MTVSKNISFFLFSLIFITLSIKIGRYPISFHDIFSSLFSSFFRQSYAAVSKTIILNIRLPRILCAFLTGVAISVSGAVYQGLFKNPMVSPSILGASSGAAFGAALGILLSFSIAGIQFVSFSTGLTAVFITYFISTKMTTGNQMISLILSGMLINTLFLSFLSLIKYVADPTDKLPEITFWLLGSFSGVENRELITLFIITTLSLIPLLLIRWKINIISFGENEAKSMGINVKLIKLIIILCSTLMTASAISVCGLISWVGLVIPHLARMMVGPDYRKLLPLCAFIGGCYLLAVDNVSRTVTAVEIPLGILTSIIGAPFFIYLMTKSKKGW